MKQRGYFEIGIVQGKTLHNLGTLWRSAYQLGATAIFSIGARHPKMQSSDTYKTWRHIPYREYDSMEAFLAARPYSCPLIGIEFPGTSLIDFIHPDRAIYLLGSEDNGLPNLAKKSCQSIVSIPSVRQASYNVAVAGSLVMFDRLAKS